MSEWAVRDTLTGAVYPQPNRLIAEKVAEMHGSSEVIPLEGEKIRDAIAEILDRGNVVPEWPDDEAEAYRSNGGFEAGRAAVRAVRVQKIIDIVRRGA